MPLRRIRVLVVDDSAVVRTVLSESLSRYPDIEVVGTAVDPYEARERIVALDPDVLTLDVEMPRMDGLSFLERLMRHRPMPVVVVSSVTPAQSEAAVRALVLGAVEVVSKPGSASSVPEVEARLVHAIRAAAQARLAAAPTPPAGVPRVSPTPVTSAASILARGHLAHRLLAIGASTGGTRAIEKVLGELPANTPGTVIVQHMPAGFTRSFARRLESVCAMEVREACDGDMIATGVALVAPGNFHMVVQRHGAGLQVRIKDGPPVHHQRPAVDVLFGSIARTVGSDAVGVLLTGMGADGARGLLAMREAGAHTIAQDEATCVVYGMPREAVELGAVDDLLPLGRISVGIARALTAPAATV